MPETKRPLNVFLSYASQDRPVVRELSLRLVGEGWIDSWLDEKKLLPGQDWRIRIEEAVEASDIVIICLSGNSVSKEGYVQKELRYAREIALEKPEETIFLIPLRLDECEVPRGLRFYQWVDYFGEKKEDSYSTLIESLKLRHEQKLKLEEIEHARKEKLEHEFAERTAREKAKREAIEKVAREKAEQEAAEKARLEAEEQARQKAAKEKADREAAEKVAHEKAERETVERANREKAMRETAERANREKAMRVFAEKAERELTEKIAGEKDTREKEEREAAEKTKQDRAALRVARIIRLKETLSKFFTSVKSIIPKILPFLRIVGLGGVVILLIWAGVWNFPKIISSISTPEDAATATELVVETVISENSPIAPTKTVIPRSTPTATTVTSFTPTLLPEPIVASITIEADGAAQKCHEAPNQLSETFYAIPAGKQISVYGKDKSGQWLYVEDEGGDRFCWISINGIQYQEGQVAKLPQGIYFSNGAEMSLVPSGTFIMGDSGNMGGHFDEKPEHSVYLDSFYMDKYEVTNQDFTVFLNDNYERVTLSDPYYLIDGQEAFSLSCETAYNPQLQNQCSLWRDKISDDLEKKQFVARPTDKDHPIVIVTWYGAMEYCKWRSDEALTVTLPTEAQWEKAARGTHEILYPWGNEKNCKYANYKGCVGNVSPVGSYTSGISPYGIYDMAGNVWEWVSDWYDGNYYDSLSSNISVNPLGPIDGEAKVFRGGSWFYDADFARTTQRGVSVGDINTFSSLTIGFRCSGMP